MAFSSGFMRTGDSSSHAKSVDEEDDDESEESLGGIKSDLRSNLSQLVAKLAVEIEQMHKEQQLQQQQQQRRRGGGGGSGGGGGGHGESGDSDAASSTDSARQKALDAILELIKDIKNSLGKGETSFAAPVVEQQVLRSLDVKFGDRERETRRW